MTDPSPARRVRRRSAFHPLRPLVAVPLLGAIFAVALLAPLPVAPNAARADIVARVEQRLPGWEVVRTLSSWEGAWTVVAACGDSHVGFQLVPGHGLRPGDAWLHPEDEYTRTRLRFVSDDGTYLVWYRDEDRPRALACHGELARPPEERRSGFLD